MKKFLTTICAVFVLAVIMGSGATTTEAKTAAYTSTITKDYRTIWSNGSQKVYLNKTRNKLYCKNLKSGKAQLLQKLKVDSESDQSYNISYVYGNNIYLSSMYGAGDGDTYVYNMKTKTYKRLKKYFIIQDAYDKYLITSEYMPTDISPYPTYVYEITSKGVKKVAKLGNNTSSAVFVNGKIYYASYPKPENADESELYRVNIYTCKKDGSAKKKIYTKKAGKKDGYIIVYAITDDIIDYTMTTKDGQLVQYEYNRTTGKTQKVTQE